MGTRAHVGTRLRGAPCNVLNSGWNFNPLPTDRKLRPACPGFLTTYDPPAREHHQPAPKKYASGEDRGYQIWLILVGEHRRRDGYSDLPASFPIGGDIGDHTLLERDLLDLARHLAQVDNALIVFWGGGWSTLIATLAGTSG